jgi:hypothetical protein
VSSSVLERRHNQLDQPPGYQCSRQGSNLGPALDKNDALPIELRELNILHVTRFELAPPERMQPKCIAVTAWLHMRNNI